MVHAPTRPRLSLLAPILVLGLVAGLLGAMAAPAASARTNPAVEAPVCGPDGGVLVRLYRAYFNRLPDRDGLRYWADVARVSGLGTVATWMAHSVEYRQRWEGTDDAGFIEGLLYHNLLGRAPDAEGHQYWVMALTHMPRDRQVLEWVQAPELVTLHPVLEPPGCDGRGIHVWAIPGGYAADLDYSIIDLRASTSRCAALSINANWFGPDGRPIGLAVVDFLNVLGAEDSQDMGVIGEYFRDGEAGTETTFAWDGSHLTSVLSAKGDFSLEMARDWQVPYWAPLHDNTQWRWAVGGIVLLIRGQQTITPERLEADAYTLLTRRHPFLAFRPPSTVTLGATTAMTAPELTEWLRAQGYRDIIKMDGGGSMEFNYHGQPLVGGTQRTVPVWLGVGC